MLTLSEAFVILQIDLRVCFNKRTLPNIMDIIAKITTFLKEVRLESKKVNWLSRQQLLSYTLVVIGFMVAMASFFGVFDYGFSLLLQKFVLGQ